MRRKEIMRKILSIVWIMLVSASIHAADWTPWQPLGDPSRGIQISFRKDSFKYDDGYMTFIRYRNNSPRLFDGIVRFKKVTTAGKVSEVKDYVKLAPNSEPKPDPGDEYIATDLTIEGIVEKSSESVNEITFPGKYTDWQEVQGMPNVSARRSNSPSDGNYHWQFKNSGGKTIELDYQYSTGGGGAVSDKLKLNSGQTSEVSLPAEKISIVPATHSAAE
jgi:hypothetical protein